MLRPAGIIAFCALLALSVSGCAGTCSACPSGFAPQDSPFSCACVRLPDAGVTDDSGTDDSGALDAGTEDDGLAGLDN